MRTKVFSMVSLLALFMTIICASCTEENVSLASNDDPISDAETYTSTLRHEPQEGVDYMTSTVTTNKGFSHEEKLNLKVVIEVSKEKYNITRDLFEAKVVSTGDLKTEYSATINGTKSIGGSILSYESKNLLQNKTFKLNDGLDGTIKCTTNNFSFTRNGKVVAMPTDSVIDMEIVSITNHVPTTEARAKTRAAAMYVADSVATDITAKVTTIEVGKANPTKQEIYVTKTVLRRILEEDAVAKVEAKNVSRTVIDSISERCQFDRVTTMKSGDQFTETKTIVLNRKFSGKQLDDLIVKSFSFTFTPNKLVAGSENEVRKEDSWTIYGKTDAYSGTAVNGNSEQFKTDYSLYHERTIYNDGAVNVDFGYETVTVSEVANKFAEAVTSDKSGYDECIFNNEVNTTYMAYSQNLSEEKKLYKIAKSVSSYELGNGKIVIGNNKVDVSVEEKITYTTGEVQTETITNSFPRSLECTSNWGAIVNNLSVSTGSATVSLDSSNKKTEGYWSYEEETRTITTKVQLPGVSKDNTWKAVVPNKIVFAKNGKNYSFGAISFAATESGSSYPKDSEADGQIVYSYSDKISVAFGENVQTSTATGTIIVEKAVSKYELSNGKIVISDNKVDVSLEGTITYTTGEVEKETYTNSFPRSLTCTSNWSATVNSLSVSTGSAIVSLESSTQRTDECWSYSEETRSIITKVQLPGVSKDNVWKAVVPNSIVFTKNGKSYSFDRIAFVATESGSSYPKASDATGQMTYSYSDQVKVAYGDNVQTSTANGTIIVEKAISKYELGNGKIVIGNNKVDVSLEGTITYTTGEVEKETYTNSFSRTLTCTSNWNATVNNLSVSTGSAVVSLTSSTQKTDGYWSYSEETRNITTNVQLPGVSKDNVWKAVVPNSIVFTKNGKSYSFDKIAFAATENGSTYPKESEANGQTTYAYSDKINVSYGDNTQSSTANGKIVVAKEVTDYRFENGKYVVYDNRVDASVDVITVYSTGETYKENVTNSFPRTLSCTSNWTATVSTLMVSTGNASVSLVSSSNKTSGIWSYVEETRSIVTKVQVYDVNKDNTWKAVVPNNITVTKGSKSYNFGKIDFSASETGFTYPKESETNIETTYGYTDNIQVVFGDNTQFSSATGKVVVTKPIDWDPDVPESWGVITKATATVALNTAGNSWLYTWSIHFEHGTLPVVVEQSANGISINQDLFSSVTNSAFNGAAYSTTRGWVNTIASNGSKMMMWKDNGGTTVSALNYISASMLGWNDGNNSVFNNDFTFEITKEGHLLTVKKKGTVFATIKAGKL